MQTREQLDTLCKVLTMHHNIVFGLKNHHEIEGSRDSQRQSIGEGALTHGVDEGHGSGSCSGRTESNKDPGTHTQAVAKLPLAAHVGSDSKEEVVNDELIFATIVQPLVKRGSLPDGVKVHANSIGTGNNRCTNDVVSVQQGSRYRFADSVNVN